MEDKQHKLWDVIIKCLGFGATVASILIGLWHFSKEQKAAADLEFNRNFWEQQNTLYVEVCRSAGSMAALVRQPDAFKKEQEKFLSLYYGALVLVEDSTVEKCMLEIRSYLDVINSEETPDEVMENKLKIKVLRLSQACKESSDIFKRSKLQ